MSICYPMVIPAAVAGGYAGGPGDLATFTAWGGLRAYNTAYATGSNPAIDIVKTSDGTAPMTINILSTGSLDVATIAGLGYGVSVTKLYDQTGNGHHWVQATLATMPTITLNAIGSLPTISFSGIQALLQPSSPTGLAQPYSVSTVAKRTGSSATTHIVLGDTAFLSEYGFSNSANTLIAYSGNVGTQGSNADNAFHAMQFVAANPNAGVISSDGVETTGLDVGTQTCDYNTVGAVVAITNPLTGAICEVGIGASNFNAGVRSSLNSQQHTYWGF